MAARRHISDSNDDGASHFDRAFRTTRWSLVLTAGDRQSARQRQALETLCRRYWQPLYFYVRRKGYDVEEAEDLIQGFFARLLEKDLLASARAERGRFRAFLKTALNYFINDEWNRSRMQKRQGSREILPLDLESAEHLYQQLPCDDLSPEVLYARQWARTLIDNAWERMRAEYVRRGRGKVVDRLQAFIEAETPDDSYDQAAEDLGMTAAAARAMVSRMRKKFRQIMRREVAETVKDPTAIQQELDNLWEIFS